MRKLLWGDTGGIAGSIFSLVAREHLASFQDGFGKIGSSEGISYSIRLDLDISLARMMSHET